SVASALKAPKGIPTSFACQLLFRLNSCPPCLLRPLEASEAPSATYPAPPDSLSAFPFAFATNPSASVNRLPFAHRCQSRREPPVRIAARGVTFSIPSPHLLVCFSPSPNPVTFHCVWRPSSSIGGLAPLPPPSISASSQVPAAVSANRAA